MNVEDLSAPHVSVQLICQNPNILNGMESLSVTTKGRMTNAMIASPI